MSLAALQTTRTILLPQRTILLPQRTIDRELSRRSLWEFVRRAWHVLEPANPFVDGAHIHAICEHLEAVTRGEIQNLLINMPPRHAKSMLVSVFWPVWEWLNYPYRRWVFASYAQSLSTRDSLKCRRLIQSRWFRERFGDLFTLIGDQNTKTRYENNHMGYRIATSVGGTGTGEGGDRVVVDDPHKVDEAESDAIRESVIRWWDETMSTRGDDPATIARVIVMQRVHHMDLAGHVLAQGGYVHLKLPAEFEEPGYSTSVGKDWRTREGQLLWPQRFKKVHLDALKIRLGTYGTAGQLQQNPTPRGGGMFKREWFQTFALGQWSRSRAEDVIQIWDTAYKDKEENDYSVCLTAALMPEGIVILDVWRGQIQFPELKRQAQILYDYWQPSIVIIEDKGSGISLVQELGRETNIPAVAIPVKDDKVVRAASATPYVEAKRVALPIHAEWLGPFLDELGQFPRGAHDDQVDVLVMAVQRLVLGGSQASLDDDTADLLRRFVG